MSDNTISISRSGKCFSLLQPTPIDLPYSRISPFHLSLALVVHASRPESLPLPEYLALLRSHVREGGRQIPEPRYIDGCELWKKRAEYESRRVSDLQAKIRELEDRCTTSSTPLPKRNIGCIKENTNKKKLRNSGVGWIAVKPSPTNPRTEPVPRPGETLDLGPLSSQTEFKELLRSLRVLRQATEPDIIIAAVHQTCRRLPKCIHEAIKIMPQASHISAPRGVSTRRNMVTNIETASRREKEVSSINQFATEICTEVLRVVRYIQQSKEEESKTRAVDATIDVAVCLIELVYSIHRNSRYIVATSCASEPCVIIDLRQSLTALLNQLFTDLRYEEEYQAGILEGFFDGCVRISSYFLQDRSFSMKAPIAEDLLMEKAAVEESGWYVLKIVETIYPLYREHCKGKFGHKAKKRLESALKILVFEGTDNPESLTFSPHVELVSSPFTSGILALVGMDIFTTEI